MKKKLLGALILSASIASVSNVAFAQEAEISNTQVQEIDVLQDDIKSEDVVKEEAIQEEAADVIVEELVEEEVKDVIVEKATEDIKEEVKEEVKEIVDVKETIEEVKEDKKEQKQEVSDEAMNQLRYAVQEMNIALGRLRSEKMNNENVEYILTFGATAIERIRPHFDELSADAYTSEYVGYINMAWTEITQAHDEYIQKKRALQALEYAYYEITVATDRLDQEGMTQDNYEYILKFGGTAVERLRPYLEQLEGYGDNEIDRKINAVRDGWDKILNAYNAFLAVGDGSEDDNYLRPELPEEPVGDGSEDDNYLRPELPEEPVGDGSEDDNYLVNTKPETKPEVKPEKKPSTSLPKTGTSSNIPTLAAGTALLAMLKLLLKRK